MHATHVDGMLTIKNATNARHVTVLVMMIVVIVFVLEIVFGLTIHVYMLDVLIVTTPLKMTAKNVTVSVHGIPIKRSVNITTARHVLK